MMVKAVTVTKDDPRWSVQNLSDAMVEVPRGEVQTANARSVERAMREAGLDGTLADTFPCSDALSSIPDPCDL